MARILVLEDDLFIAEAMIRCLRERHHTPVHISRGDKGLEEVLHGEYALLVLDLTLPGLSGMEVCRRMRQAGSSVPVLMVTARDALDERVRGLEIGADDYLVKPFEYAEFAARVQAQLRRERMNRGRSVEVGRLRVDTQERQAWIDGQVLPLTPIEYGLLESLATNEGRVLSRDVLTATIWGKEQGSPNLVDVHVGILRKKLEPYGVANIIRTVRGFGYSFRREGL